MLNLFVMQFASIVQTHAFFDVEIENKGKRPLHPISIPAQVGWHPPDPSFWKLNNDGTLSIPIQVDWVGCFVTIWDEWV